MCLCWVNFLCWIVITSKHGSWSEGPERALLASQPETQKDQGPYAGQSGGSWVDFHTGRSAEEGVSATSSTSFVFRYDIEATVDMPLMWGKSQGDLPLLWPMWHRMELHLRPPDAAVAIAMGRRRVETDGFPEEEASGRLVVYGPQRGQAGLFPAQAQRQGGQGEDWQGRQGPRYIGPLWGAAADSADDPVTSEGTQCSYRACADSPTYDNSSQQRTRKYVTADIGGAEQKPGRLAAFCSGDIGCSSTRRFQSSSKKPASTCGGPRGSQTTAGSHSCCSPRLRARMGAICHWLMRHVAKATGREGESSGGFPYNGSPVGTAVSGDDLPDCQSGSGPGRRRDHRRGGRRRHGRGGHSHFGARADRSAKTTPSGADAGCGPEDHGDATSSGRVCQSRSCGARASGPRTLTEAPNCGDQGPQGCQDRQRRKVYRRGGFAVAAALVCWRGSEAAPSVGSTLSLTGDVEPINWALSVPKISYSHTIRDEWDFTCPRTAQFFGLRMQFEVVLDKLGVYSDLLLDRRQMDGPCQGCRVQLKDKRPSVNSSASFRCANPGPLRSCLKRDTAPKGRCVSFEPCTVFIEEAAAVHSFLETPAPDTSCVHSRHVQPVVGTAEQSLAAATACQHTASLARSKVGTCRTLPGPHPAGDHLPLPNPSRVPPLWACTDGLTLPVDGYLPMPTRPGHHVSDALPLAQFGPSQFSEIRLRITASIDLYPADMDRPEIRQQQLSSHDWLTGWRIRGGVGLEAQQDRYALYSTEHHLQMRTMKRGWSINELVADVAGVIPRLRSVRLLVDRLDGLPAIQIAATTREAPTAHHAVPLDLRGAGGRVCTINMEPGLSADTIRRRIFDECPASHVPQQDFHLVLPDSTPLHVLPGPAEWPDFLRGQPGLPPLGPPLPIVEEEGDQVQLLQHSMHCDLPQLPSQSHMRASKTGPVRQGPVLHPQCCQGYRMMVKDREPSRPAVKYTIMPPNLILAQPALTPSVAVGGVSAAQMERSRFYTIFEPRIDLRQRPADPQWQLADFVTDAVRQLPEPVRMVFVLSRPLPSFATPQLVLTLHSALPRARSLPVDLRGVGGMVHTVELLPRCSPADVWAALRSKGIDLSGHWEIAHAAGHVRFLNQLGLEVIEWGIDDDRLEWVELTATTAEWQECVITYGSTEAQALVDRLASTSTTTAVGPSQEEEPRDPPTLLRTLTPADACASHSLAGIQVLPAYLASQSLSTISATDLCLYVPTATAADGTRPFTVFVPGISPIVRTADPQWPMCRFLTEALSLSDQAVRQVQFLPLSMPDLPTPQFVITPATSLPGITVWPVDARELGGSICTIAVSEGESSHSIMASIATAQPNIQQAIQALLAFDAVFLQDAAGQVWDTGPPESVASSWLALRCDQGRLQQAPPALRHLIASATTTTTTAALAAHDPEPVLTVVLAGGGLLLRSVPLPLSQVQVASVVADLVLALAANGRLPQEPVISVAASMPRSAASPHHHMIGFIVTEMAEADREVVIFQDPSLDGSLLSAVAIDRGTFVESMVAPAQTRRGFAAALNGAPQEGARRHLITGDFIQIYQRPLAARTWPVAHMYSILPALRLFALPIRLPGARSFLGRLPANADRSQARRDLLQMIELRMLEQAMDLGEPGPGGYPVIVMGPAHVPMMVYVPEASPNHEATMRFLTYSGLFTPGTTYAATTALSGTVPVVVSIPPQDHLLTALYPTPDATTTWLQLSIGSDVSLHSLGLPVRRGMELIYPPRLTHATVLHERVARSRGRPPARDPADMSLIQTHVQLSHEPSRSELVAPKALGKGQMIPTPLGRRSIRPLPPTEPHAEASQDRGPGKVHRLELSSLLPVSPPAITWEVNQDICDFCLAAHSLSSMTGCPSRYGKIPNKVLGLWNKIPLWCPEQPCNELFVFTDGSYTAANRKPTWAVVLVARQGKRLGRIGVVAGAAQGPQHSHPNLQRAPSAYDGELEAAMHGLAIAAANNCPVCHIGIDCSSALQVIQGLSATTAADKVARAAIGLKALLATQGKQIYLHKVLAHGARQLCAQRHGRCGGESSRA